MEKQFSLWRLTFSPVWGAQWVHCCNILPENVEEWKLIFGEDNEDGLYVVSAKKPKVYQICVKLKQIEQPM